MSNMLSLNLADWKILVADDEPDNLSLLQDILSFFDTTVVLAASGEEAITHVKEQTFTLALLDIQMPKVSGLDVLKAIRSHENPVMQKMLVIAVTAIAMPGDKERLLEAGFNGYISKPIEVTTFMDTIRAVVQEQAANVIPKDPG
jgi:CheY-like chemotaxis protein